MTLGVVGLGLLTPFGRTPAEHVFGLRAGGPPPPPSPYQTEATRAPLGVRYCRWLGAQAPLPARMVRLAERALADAKGGLTAARRSTRVLLTVAKNRPGLDEAGVDAVVRAVEHAGSVRRYAGDAGAFAALRDAGSMIASGEARLAFVLGVDSSVSVAALDAFVRSGPSDWEPDAPPPSEGAAALALMDTSEARRDGIEVIALVHGAAVATGGAHDENADPPDGAAMCAILRELAPERPVATAFGPYKVDLLRRDEWRIASARLHARFAAPCHFVCLESSVGRLGAASGIASAVYGIAMHHHVAAEAPESSRAPFYAWALSPDGARGAALMSVKVA